MLQASSKILVIRLSSLGDLVLMMPMLRALRAGFPAAEIHLLCKEKYTGLFEGSDCVDRIIVVKEGGLGELMRIRSWLSHERYDVIIDAHNVIRSNILFHTLGAPKKLQIAKCDLKKLLLIRGKTNLYRTVVSQSGRYRELARRLGADIRKVFEELPVPETAVRGAERALSSSGPVGRRLIAFAPGARWRTKRWPQECYAELITGVSRLGYEAVIIGGPDDAAANANVARMSNRAPLDLTGKLSIMESAAVLRRCTALVTNDSAPLHLAEAVGTPVVAFFGPTVREFGYYPRLVRSRVLEVALPCRPCSRNGARKCPYGTTECLTAIGPSVALETLVEVLEETKARV
ncbi:MAG TPA: glycosyltransferase family 9 protein [Candidatus Krumholzibacteriaceae bacterium]